MNAPSQQTDDAANAQPDAIRRDEYRLIPLADLVEPWVVLRTINRASVEYLEIRDSLAARGFLNSICVRPSKRHPGKFEVVDGLVRFTAARDLQLAGMPAIIKASLTDEDVLAAQIQANALRIETTPVEYARQLKKIMASDPAMTLTKLSLLVHKGPVWLAEQLSLLTLIKLVQTALDRGELTLSVAYALARVPKVHQKQFYELSKTLQAQEVVPIIQAFVKRFKESVKKGKLDAFYQTFEPVAHLRGLKEVQAEYRGQQVGSVALVTAGCQSPLDAWYLALEWVLHLDKESVDAQRERLAERQKQATLKPSPEQEEDEEA